MDSILLSIKKLLGITETETHFDIDVIIYINTALSILNQIGIGKELSIVDDSTKWVDFLVDEKFYEMAKTYVYMKVKLIFDPPASATLVEALKDSINELEWRLYTRSEVEDSSK